jgi:XRE family transcriptional regulator, stress-response regulator
MVLLRHMLGDALRRLRLRQGRTLREVSAAARVSLGYLSEVERGQKEASSELLASICGALGAPLSQVLREVSDSFALAELQNEPVYAGPVSHDGPMEPALDGPPAPRPAGHDGSAVPAGTPSAARRMPVPAGARLPMAVGPSKISVRPDRSIISEPGQVLGRSQLPASAPRFDRISDITNMVPV